MLTKKPRMLFCNKGKSGGRSKILLITAFHRGYRGKSFDEYYPWYFSNNPRNSPDYETAPTQAVDASC